MRRRHRATPSAAAITYHVSPSGSMISLLHSGQLGLLLLPSKRPGILFLKDAELGITNFFHHLHMSGRGGWWGAALCCLSKGTPSVPHEWANSCGCGGDVGSYKSWTLAPAKLPTSLTVCCITHPAPPRERGTSEPSS